MNVLKNFEAVFISAAAIACTGAYLLGAPSTSAPLIDAGTPVAGTPVQVVVVTGKRMTADEKLQSMREERQMAIARNNAVQRG